MISLPMPRVTDRRVSVLVVMLACAACTTGGTVGPERAARTTQSLNLSGFPPEYRKGFTDGCAAVGAPKPASAPSGAEPQFQQGYKDGFSYCTRRPPR